MAKGQKAATGLIRDTRAAPSCLLPARAMSPFSSVRAGQTAARARQAARLERLAGASTQHAADFRHGPSSSNRGHPSHPFPAIVLLHSNFGSAASAWACSRQFFHPPISALSASIRQLPMASRLELLKPQPRQPAWLAAELAAPLPVPARWFGGRWLKSPKDRGPCTRLDAKLAPPCHLALAAAWLPPTGPTSLAALLDLSG